LNSETNVRLDKKKGSKFTFPWWCLFLAYGFSLVLVIISMFFLIVRGIEFGDLKTQKWLTSLIAGFFSSILLIQPIKVRSILFMDGGALNFVCLFERFSHWPFSLLVLFENQTMMKRQWNI
jgi:hypothetical protein